MANIQNNVQGIRQGSKVPKETRLSGGTMTWQGREAQCAGTMAWKVTKETRFSGETNLSGGRKALGHADGGGGTAHCVLNVNNTTHGAMEMSATPGDEDVSHAWRGDVGHEFEGPPGFVDISDCVMRGTVDHAESKLSATQRRTLSATLRE